MEDFFEALGVIVKKLYDIDFALVGTFNLFVQGVDMRPHDLDLISDDSGIKKIAKIFNSKLTKEDLYLETRFSINKVEVHVVSDKNNSLRDPFRESIIWIEIKGLKIPCMSLNSELSFYRKVNREKDKGKVELIQKKLSGGV